MGSESLEVVFIVGVIIEDFDINDLNMEIVVVDNEDFIVVFNEFNWGFCNYLCGFMKNFINIGVIYVF